MKKNEHPARIEVSNGMRGWFAVLLTWTEYPGFDGGGFYEPEQTGIGSYATRDEAVREALDWAKAEGIECREMGR